MDKVILEKLILENKSIKQIGQELDYSRTNIVYWLKKYGLSTPRNRYNKNFNKKHRCSSCGETDPAKFNGHKKSICGKCNNKYCQMLGRKKRKQAIEYKGGKCEICGYDKCIKALEFHHKDPEKKDKNWGRMRGWKWEKIKKEIEKCDLLCCRCHREIHSELDAIKYNKATYNYSTKEAKPFISKQCQICGKDFKTKKDNAKFCSYKCSNLNHRKVKHPSKEELAKDIKEIHNFCEIGRKYNVTDNAVRKWARKYELI